MLTLNLKEIFKRRSKFRAHYFLDPKEINLPADVGEIKNPVEVDLEIQKEKGGYNFKISIKGNIVLECSRCLTVFEKDISQSWELRMEKYRGGETLHLRPRDLDVSFFEDEESVNIGDIVKEQILLSIPIKPLCSPDCKPYINLEESRETPFSALKKLLK